MRGTIKSKQEVERLFRRGKRVSSSVATILYLPAENTDEPGRCAFIAGKKLGDAPLRSRCKRVMREVTRELGAPWNGYDIVFVARKAVAFEPHETCLREMRRSLNEAGVL